jgi:hypothetical protein
MGASKALDSAEREHVGLGAGLEERDLQRPLADSVVLAHELLELEAAARGFSASHQSLRAVLRSRPSRRFSRRTWPCPAGGKRTSHGWSCCCCSMQSLKRDKSVTGFGYGCKEPLLYPLSYGGPSISVALGRGETCAASAAPFTPLLLSQGLLRDVSCRYPVDTACAWMCSKASLLAISSGSSRARSMYP